MSRCHQRRDLMSTKLAEEDPNDPKAPEASPFADDEFHDVVGLEFDAIN